jgi:flagellin
MRELAVQSASSTVNDDNRTSANAEFNQLVNEIDRIAKVTSYNNSALLSGYGNTVNQDVAVSTALASPTTGVTGVRIAGSAAGTYVFSDTAGDNQITLGNGVTSQTINASLILDQNAVGSIDNAILGVTKARGDLGAVQNRLSFSMRATGVMLENDKASDSSIRDADIAAEVSAFSRAQILQQSGLSVFAQVNIQPASALNLI